MGSANDTDITVQNSASIDLGSLALLVLPSERPHAALHANEQRDEPPVGGKTDGSTASCGQATSSLLPVPEHAWTMDLVVA
jgi:hypothetical protein